MHKALTIKWTLWIITLLLSAENVSANPQGANVISGQASLAHPSATALTITNSPNAIINWQSFDINPNEITRFIQQNGASAVLNRVVGNGLTASQIMGTLASNGKVFLINPNGIVFGPNSVVDTAGLIASSLNISDQDFLNNNLRFDGNASNGAIDNKGYITAGLNGDVFLIAPNIENSGIIETNGGHIILAAGEKVSLASFENENIIFQVQSPDNKVTNLGSINTNGGAAELFAGTITHSGSINANSISVNDAGEITLAAISDIHIEADSMVTANGPIGGNIHIESEAGELLQQGTLSANQIHLIGSMVNNVGQTQANSSDTNTASINIEGDYVLQQGVLKATGGIIDIQANSLYHSGLTSTDNPDGNGGDISITTTSRFEATGNSLMTARGETGGSLQLDGTAGQIIMSATIDVRGTQSGGTVEVTANTVALLNANIKSDGGVTGGNIHIGGEWQGSGDLDQAKEVIVGVGTELSATGETGGEIVIWSTESTSFYGSADTTGSLLGGQIELSSLGELDWMGPDFAPITPGDGGLLLLDPKNIIVTDTPPSGLSLATKLAEGSNVGATLTISDGDDFGRSVSLDGDLLAVGAYFSDTGGVDRGEVYLFNGVGTDYSGLTLQDKLIHGWSDGVSTLTLVDSDFFGAAVSLDGGRLAVGAYGNDTGGTLAGSVYLFNGVGTDYTGLTLQDQLVSGWTDGASTLTLQIGDLFGWSLSLNGDFLAIGATGDDTGGAQRGAVHLFNGVGTDFSGLTLKDKLTDGWTDGVTTLTLVDNDNFGNAISLDGDLLAVGAYRDDTGGTSRGAVYLLNGVGTDYTGLTIQTKLVAGWSDGDSSLLLANGDIFGASVSLDGGLLAVGANGDDTGGTNRGAIHLFNSVGTDYSGLKIQDKLAHGWTDGISTLTLVDSDQFGVSVSLDGNNLAVGAFLDDTGGINRGAIYLFNGVTGGGAGSVGDALFATNAADTLYLTSLSITNVLDTGADLILQANNDITISNDLTVAEGGSGGDFTLQAGRSIFIDASIFTDNGLFAAYANHGSANQTYRDAGAATINVSSGASINTGSGDLILELNSGVGGNLTSEIQIGGTLSTTSDMLKLLNRGVGQQINLLSTATLNSGTGTSSHLYLFADDLNVDNGLTTTGYSVYITPWSNNIDIGIGGGAGGLNITENELNNFSFSNDVSIFSNNGGDINIGSYTSTKSSSFYRFQSNENLTLDTQLTTANSIVYLSVDQNGGSADTLTINGTISSRYLSLYGCNFGCPTADDVLQLPNTNNTITISDNSANNTQFATLVSDNITLSQTTSAQLYRFANLSGGTGNDAFVMDYSGTPSVGSMLNGGNGVDTLNYSNNTTGIIFDLANSTTTDVGNISNIESYIGGSGIDQFLMGDTNITGTLNGGAGIDILSYASRTTASTILLSNSNLMNIESFIGSPQNDIFSFADSSGGSGFSIDAFDGGVGTDTIMISNGTTTLTGGTVDADINNSGTINITSNVRIDTIFTNSGTMNIGANYSSDDGSLINNATVNWTAGDLIELGGLASITNTGTFNISGNNANGIDFTNSGTLSKTAGGATSSFTGSFTNTGTVNASSGLLEFSGYTQTAGLTQLNGGNINEVGGTATINGGTLAGIGTFTAGDLNINGATLAPGASPGTLNIVGNLNLGSTSTTLIELGGTNQGVDYDFINVTGNVALDGILNISLFGGFTGITGNSFDVIQSGGVMNGAFATVNLPTGYSFNTGIFGGNLYRLGLLVVPVAPTPTTSTESDFDSLQEQTANEVLVLEENYDAWNFGNRIFGERTAEEYDDQAQICT